MWFSTFNTPPPTITTPMCMSAVNCETCQNIYFSFYSSYEWNKRCEALFADRDNQTCWQSKWVTKLGTMVQLSRLNQLLSFLPEVLCGVNRALWTRMSELKYYTRNIELSTLKTLLNILLRVNVHNWHRSWRVWDSLLPLSLVAGPETRGNSLRNAATGEFKLKGLANRP